MKKLKMLSILLIPFIFINSVYAKSVISTDENILIEGRYNSSNFAFGNKVRSTADIDGLSLVAGNDIEIKGSATYGIYGGNNLTINANIEKDLFIAGNTINIGSKSTIGRDVYITGNSIKINTDIIGNARIAAASVDLSNITINGNAYIETGELILDNTVINGTLSYNDDATVTGKESASIGKEKTRDSISIKTEITLVDRFKTLITSIVSAVVFIILVLYLAPKTKEKLNAINLSSDNVVKTSILGLLILIGLPFGCLIALITVFLIPIGLIGMLIYGISIYASSLVTGYIIGNELGNKGIKTDNMYVNIIIGIALIKILIVIPIIGGLVSFISMIYGLGTIYNITVKK